MATTELATTGSFEGADVDALDKLAQEFQQAAQVCDEVRMACEIIVAAASFFGPFGAAFIAYLKETVIPWLKKISEALQLMSKVLSTHSQAQKDASSSSTSLASYVTPGNLPQTSTTDGPTMSAIPPQPTTAPYSQAVTTTPHLFGLITIGTDANGNTVDVGAGPSNSWLAEHLNVHLNRDAAGDVTGISTAAEARLGSVSNPLVDLNARSGGNLILDSTGNVVGVDATSSESATAFGSRPLTGNDHAVISTITDRTGATIGLRGSGTEDLSLGDTPLVRTTASGSLVGTGPTDMDARGNIDTVFGPGQGDRTSQDGALPGGAKLPEMVGGDSGTGYTYRPPEVAIGGSYSTGSYGDSSGASVLGRLVGGDVHGSNQDGLLKVGGDIKGDVSFSGGYFSGTNHFDNQTTAGTYAAAAAGAGIGPEAGVRIGTDHTYVLGQGGYNFGVPGSFDVGAYALKHGPDAAPSYDAGGNVDVKDVFNVGGRIHHDTGSGGE